MGDVFTSCNWIMRDGCGILPPTVLRALHSRQYLSAPKTATKRVFLITDEDNPHSVPGGDRLLTSARTTLIVCLPTRLFLFRISPVPQGPDPSGYRGRAILHQR